MRQCSEKKVAVKEAAVILLLRTGFASSINGQSTLELGRN